MGTFANSEDPDEMQHNAAFHQGQHCLPILKQPSGTEIHQNLEISTCDPLKCSMGSPIVIASIYMGNYPSEYKGFKMCFGLWLEPSFNSFNQSCTERSWAEG